MANTQDEKALERVVTAIEQLKENDFTVYFFVVDGKNVPNGTLEYIYRLAKTIKDKGYNVRMAYQLNDEYTPHELRKITKKNGSVDMTRVFEGVINWLGPEYKDLEHINVAHRNWELGPCDILFIPEAMVSLMQTTFQHKAPCRRIVILNDYRRMVEFLPIGTEWGSFGIFEAIASSNTQATMVHDLLPYTSIRVLPPCIDDCFRKPLKAPKLIVNMLCREKSDVHRIIQQFILKYPVYKFVAFRDIRDYKRDKYAELLQEGAISVWVDEHTPFGYSALEAMRCGNVLIGKVPTVIPEWMENDGDIRGCAIWTYDINSIPELLAKTIATWMQDKIPQSIMDEAQALDNSYSAEQWDKNVEELITNLVKERLEQFEKIERELTTKVEHNEVDEKEDTK